MAQVTIRANLSNVQIPLLTEEFGRSVIVRQQDLNYNPTLASKADVDKDVGIPQVYYAHNVMPTNYGYRSISYSNQIAPLGIDTFSQVINLLSISGAKAFLAVTTDGSLYVSHVGVGYVWTQITGFMKATYTEGTNTGTGYIASVSVLNGSAADVYLVTMTSATAFQVKKNGVNEATGTTGTEYVSANGKMKFTLNSGTTAFVAGDNFTLTLSAATFLGAITYVPLSGETYIASEGNGIFQYDFTANTLIWRMAVGIEPAQLLGIAGANGYLIVYSIDTVTWSSTIDPLDFIPSLSTGAGGGSVEEAKGPIRRIVSLTSGFIVFTAANAVAAIFGQNIRFPFTFREIPNAGGISDLTLVTDEADSTSVYAFTTHGLQQISTQKATNVMPELSDMLTGKRFEDFDTGTLTFSTQNLTNPLKKRVEFISGRFLVISYGISSFTHSIIYDTSLQRFGKLKIDHVSAFQYGFLDADDADTPKKQIALITKNGQVKTVEFAAGVTSDDSVIFLGKFQYMRSRVLTLENVELETIDEGAALTIYDYATSDGKTFTGTPISGWDTGLTGLTRSYNFHNTGMNHSLLAKGTFRLNSMQLTFTVGGDR